MLIETVRRVWEEPAKVIKQICRSGACRFAFPDRLAHLDIAVGAEVLPSFQNGIVSTVMEVECCQSIGQSIYSDSNIGPRSMLTSDH